MRRPPPVRELKDGQGFDYLGRSYRLRLVAKQDVPVRLCGGRLNLRRDVAPHGREHLLAWYTTHATRWLCTRVEPWARRIGVEPAGLAVTDLGFRWASCSAGGKLRFHWKAFQLPPHAIDYVIVHELVHLRERLHTPRFWRLVERAMPDFGARKRWLAENGARFGA